MTDLVVIVENSSCFLLLYRYSLNRDRLLWVVLERVIFKHFLGKGFCLYSLVLLAKGNLDIKEKGDVSRHIVQKLTLSAFYGSSWVFAAPHKLKLGKAQATTPESFLAGNTCNKVKAVAHLHKVSWKLPNKNEGYGVYGD